MGRRQRLRLRGPSGDELAMIRGDAAWVNDKVAARIDSPRNRKDRKARGARRIILGTNDEPYAWYKIGGYAQDRYTIGFAAPTTSLGRGLAFAFSYGSWRYRWETME
jgi:hypothetical protein